jgi:hypothetical protein
VRLGGCILLELALGATLIAGVGGGAYYGGRRLLDETGGTAYAAPSNLEPPLDDPALGLLPLLDHSVDPPRLPDEAPPQGGYFLGVQDELLLQPLLSRKIARVKFNRGGSSISLRIDFEGGGRAAFKPDQTNLQTVPRKEVAAYRVSRLLGLSSVAPSAGRSFARDEIVAHLDEGSQPMLPRLMAEMVVDADGDVTGELSWWIPEIRDAKIHGYTIDSVDGMVTWKRYLQAGAPIPYEERELLPQISTMVAFDFLISNSDRWSGSNAKASPDGEMLYFMDNALSFGPNPGGHEKVLVYLQRVQKFSRSLYASLRRLEAGALRDAVARDPGPYERLLTDEEIEGVMYRRDQLVGYIDGLILEHGESAVLVFP